MFVCMLNGSYTCYEKSLKIVKSPKLETWIELSHNQLRLELSTVFSPLPMQPEIRIISNLLHTKNRLVSKGPEIGTQVWLELRHWLEALQHLDDRISSLMESDGRNVCKLKSYSMLDSCRCKVTISSYLLIHTWHSQCSSDSQFSYFQFITWKKAYRRCKGNARSWSSPLKDSSEESCLLDVIR